MTAPSEVWGAVLASTLTTIAVFVPIVFIEEQAGQLFRDIAIAISAGVGLSLLVSITVIPCLSARILTTRNRETGRHRSSSRSKPDLMDRRWSDRGHRMGLNAARIGEFHLLDVRQYLLARGDRIRTHRVSHWHNRACCCQKPNTCPMGIEILSSALCCLRPDITRRSLFVWESPLRVSSLPIGKPNRGPRRKPPWMVPAFAIFSTWRFERSVVYGRSHK